MLFDTLMFAIPGASLVLWMVACMYDSGIDVWSRSSTDAKTPKPKDATEAEILKTGWELLEKMNNDIHRLYHPDGCQCAFCEILGDDDTDAAPVPERATEDDPWVLYEDDGPPPIVNSMEPSTAREVIIRQHTAIKNLESQVRELGNVCVKLNKENEALKQAKGIRSAGMHVGGKPLYQLEEPKWSDRQLGTLLRKCYDCGEKAFRLIGAPEGEGDGEIAVCKECWKNYQRSATEIGCKVTILEEL